MFAYNPTVNDMSGQIRGEGIVNAAQMNAQAKMKLADDIGSAVVSLAGSYAGAKAQAAELQGYDEVFKMHGQQLGFSGEDVERILKMPDQQRRGLYTSFYQNHAPYAQRMDYLNTQMAPRATTVNAGYGTAPAASGAGGGGGGDVLTF
jgi:hypothetical protein